MVPSGLSNKSLEASGLWSQDRLGLSKRVFLRNGFLKSPNYVRIFTAPPPPPTTVTATTTTATTDDDDDMMMI